MGFHRRLAELERIGQFGVVQAAGKQGEHLAFSGSERGQVWLLYINSAPSPDITSQASPHVVETLGLGQDRRRRIHQKQNPASPRARAV